MRPGATLHPCLTRGRGRLCQRMTTRHVARMQSARLTRETAPHAGRHNQPEGHPSSIQASEKCHCTSKSAGARKKSPVIAFWIFALVCAFNCACKDFRGKNSRLPLYFRKDLPQMVLWGGTNYRTGPPSLSFPALENRRMRCKKLGGGGCSNR